MSFGVKVRNFGDGKSEVTTTNKVTHTYDSMGSYKINITITDSKERTFNKTFDITVGSPKEIINSILAKKQKDLTNVKNQINEFDSFSSESLNSALDIESVDEELKTIQKANKPCETFCSQKNYDDILDVLLYLKVPELIRISKSTDPISFYPDKNIINLEILKVIGGGKYNSNNEDKYFDAILSWNQENMETKITSKGFSVRYAEFEEPFLKIFELKISKKNVLDYNPYLILRELDDLKFKESYSEDEESGYIYIDLTESDETIIFSTTEDVNFIDLPVFISPEINKLPVMTPSLFSKDEKGWKWALFILIVSLLLLIGIIAYIVLQMWYKKKYENYLFKNKNKLYNLVKYIQNAQRNRVKDKDIASKLRKAGWSSEKIRYIMRKYSGKRTGMLEIPVQNFLGKYKKRAMPGKRNINLRRTNRFGQRRPQRRFFKKH